MSCKGLLLLAGGVSLETRQTSTSDNQEQYNYREIISPGMQRETLDMLGLNEKSPAGPAQSQFRRQKQ